MPCRSARWIVKLALSRIKVTFPIRTALTRKAPEEEIGHAIEVVTLQHATAYFRDCGFVPV